jgi:putative selenate reductase molybdopterin-binding subunit
MNMSNNKFKVVNTSAKKMDSTAMALGKPIYVEDMIPSNALHVKMLWSPHAHANIKSIDTSTAEKMPGVKCILHHGNVKRTKSCTAGQGFPEPSPYDTCIFDNKVRFVGDRVAAVAAETKEQAAAAVKAIKIEYELLEPAFTIDEALREGAPVIHDEEDSYVPIPFFNESFKPEKNIVGKAGMKSGDFEKAFKESDLKFDETFTTSRAQHVPLENYVATAYLDPYDRLIINSSTQVVYHCRRIVARLLDIPIQRIRVMKPRFGGGFGCKQEMTIEDVVGMFALRTKRQVAFVFDRQEMFMNARTRHPGKIRFRFGINKATKSIDALGLDVINNTGAYGGHGVIVATCYGSKTLPLYHVDNIHFDATAIYTNMPISGAYRGFGATQCFFALESMIDIIAESINIDPLEFRKMNHIQEGESHQAFTELGEGKDGAPMRITSISLDECIDIGAKEIGWNNRTSHKEKSGRYRRGIGMAIAMQGSSISNIDMASVAIKMNDDGSFNLYSGCADLGTGADTVLAQIAAEALHTDNKKFIVHSGDTDFTPFDKGAYASSTTYLSGEASRKAAIKVRDQILKAASGIFEEKTGTKISVDDLCICDGGIVKVKDREDIKSITYPEIAKTSLYESRQFQIASYASNLCEKCPPPFTANFVEIEVDTETGEIKVLKFVACVDCGTAINPCLAEGQVEGSVLNAISYALTEEYIYDSKGKVLNNSLNKYGMYSLRDKPEMKCILVPSYEETGPFGAKSVSEICLNGAMPSIANALYNATGCRIYSAPFTKEKVWRLLKGKPEFESHMK